MSLNSKSNRDVLVASAATIVVITATWQLLRPSVDKLLAHYRVQRLLSSTNKDGNNGTVSDLFIHPVKSLRAIALQQSSMDAKGLSGDRRFMVVYASPLPPYKTEWEPKDCSHRFLSQRQCPSFATVVTELDDDFIVLKYGTNTLKLALEPPSPVITYRAGIWSDEVVVEDMGDEAAAFFQAIVNADENCLAGDEGDVDTDKCMYQNVRLVCHSASDRLTDPNFTPAIATSWLLGQSPAVALTDGFPVLIACQASLDALNEKLAQNGKPPIAMSQFRPNIVVKGTQAFEEDSWKTIAVGDQLFSVVKACSRCKESCTNQETGTVSEEPVATMKSFRQFSGDDVFFAQNAIPLGKPGTIKVGDAVRVVERKDPVYP